MPSSTLAGRSPYFSARTPTASVHTDAAQAAGKIPFDAAEIGVGLCTVVGHKMYAPKGIASLYVRPGLSIEPVIYGGGQNRGRRAPAKSPIFSCSAR